MASQEATGSNTVAIWCGKMISHAVARDSQPIITFFHLQNSPSFCQLSNVFGTGESGPSNFCNFNSSRAPGPNLRAFYCTQADTKRIRELISRLPLGIDPRSFAAVAGHSLGAAQWHPKPPLPLRQCDSEPDTDWNRYQVQLINNPFDFGYLSTL